MSVKLMTKCEMYFENITIIMGDNPYMRINCFPLPGESALYNFKRILLICMYILQTYTTWVIINFLGFQTHFSSNIKKIFCTFLPYFNK